MWKRIKKFGWVLVSVCFIVLIIDSCIKASNNAPVDLNWGSIIIMELNLLISSILGLIDEYK